MILLTQFLTQSGIQRAHICSEAGNAATMSSNRKGVSKRLADGGATRSVSLNPGLSRARVTYRASGLGCIVLIK